MKDIIKLAVILSFYTVVACISLALVHGFTSPIIEKHKEEAVKRALQSIFPLADNFDDVFDKLDNLDNIEGSIAITAAHVAKKDGRAIGFTIQASGPTYSKATILMGIDLDKKIASIKFLELLDTPSLGSKAADSPFIDQFPNKSTEDAFEVGKDIEAISGATITSKGVCAILKVAGSIMNKYIDKTREELYEDF